MLVSRYIWNDHDPTCKDEFGADFEQGLIFLSLLLFFSSLKWYNCWCLSDVWFLLRSLGLEHLRSIECLRCSVRPFHLDWVRTAMFQCLHGFWWYCPVLSFSLISLSGLHVINPCKSNSPQHPPHCHLGPPISSHAEFYLFSAPLSMIKYPIYLSSFEGWSVLHLSSFTFIYFYHLPIRPASTWNSFYLLPLKFHSCVLLVHCLNI